MSKVLSNSINKHNTFLEKIILESSKSNGKKVIDMINELSLSVLKDIDSLRSLMHRKEEESEIKEGLYEKKRILSKPRSVTFFKKPKEIEIVMTEEINVDHKYKLAVAKNDCTMHSNSVTGQDESISISEHKNDPSLHLYSIESTSTIEILGEKRKDMLGNTGRKSREVEKLFVEKEILKSNLAHCMQKNQELEKKKKNTHMLSNYETLYREKNQELEIIEKKFNEISEKFFIMLEKIKLSQNSFIEDITHLQELIIFILQSFTHHNFDAINFLIKYIGENETFLGNVNWNQESFLNSRSDNHFDIERENQYDKQIQIPRHPQACKETLTPKFSDFSNDLQRVAVGQLTQVDFEDLKLIKKIPSGNLNLVHASSSFKRLEFSRQNMSYREIKKNENSFNRKYSEKRQLNKSLTLTKQNSLEKVQRASSLSETNINNAEQVLGMTMCKSVNNSFNKFNN